MVVPGLPRASRRPWAGLALRLGVVALAFAAGLAIGTRMAARLHELLREPFGEALFYAPSPGLIESVIHAGIPAGVIAALPVAVLLGLGARAGARSIHPAGIASLVLGCYLLSGAGLAIGLMLILPQVLEIWLASGSYLSADRYVRDALGYLALVAAAFQLPLLLPAAASMRPGTARLLAAHRLPIWAGALAVCALTPVAGSLKGFALLALPVLAMCEIALLLALLPMRLNLALPGRGAGPLAPLRSSLGRIRRKDSAAAAPPSSPEGTAGPLNRRQQVLDLRIQPRPEPSRPQARPPKML